MVMFGLYILIGLRSEINFLVIFEEHIFNARGEARSGEATLFCEQKYFILKSCKREIRNEPKTID